jgi:shikimate dehydrogenase
MYWKLGMLGFPVEHSLSPQLHEEGLRLMGYQGSSRRVEVRKEDADGVGELIRNEFDAVSATMPLKPLLAQFCVEIDDVAMRTSSINSVLKTEDGLIGASTDGGGLVSALRGEFDFDTSGLRAVVIGAGGSARAIVDALVSSGASGIEILSRTPATVDALVSSYESTSVYQDATRSIDLIINTTPALNREVGNELLSGVSKDTIAVDITYSPPVSEWLAMHAETGCRTQNGLPMLAYQAALQMNWWWKADLSGSDLLKVIRD